MNLKFNSTHITKKGLYIIVFLLVIVIAGCSGGTGEVGGFSTSDGSIDEWAGVPVFYSDPTGDVPNPDEDIVEIKVANAPAGGATEAMFFLMKTAGNPALQGKFKAAVVSIDCVGNGVDQEPHDRLVVFVQSESQMFIMRGDQSEMFRGPGTDGQVVNEYVEWNIAMDNLPPDDKDSVECSGNVKLRFATADASEFAGTGEADEPAFLQWIDDTGELIDWNIP